MIESGVTITIDGRAFSESSARATRPVFRVFTIFCDRHPIPGLRHVCRVPMPKPAPSEWCPQDIIVCFGWRADADIDHSVDAVVGDAFFTNTGLKEHAWEPPLMERRLVYQFFAPPEPQEQPAQQHEQLTHGWDDKPQQRQQRPVRRGAYTSRGGYGNDDEDEDDDGVGGGGGGNKAGGRRWRQPDEFGSRPSLLPNGARNKPFRVHDFEMHEAADAGYEVFKWETFSADFSRAIGEAFLRGL